MEAWLVAQAVDFDQLENPNPDEQGVFPDYYAGFNPLAEGFATDMEDTLSIVGSPVYGTEHDTLSNLGSPAYDSEETLSILGSPAYDSEETLSIQGSPAHEADPID